MRLTISDVDYAPDELHDQVPFEVELLRQIPGPDRPDYWLGSLTKPLRWTAQARDVDHLVLVARWEGTQITLDMKQLPVGIAYVTDPTLRMTTASASTSALMSPSAQWRK